MTEIVIALVASIPGLLLGLAAILKARSSACPERVAALEADLARTKREMDGAMDELGDAQARITILEQKVEDCEVERRRLERENLSLYRRLDKGS